MLAPQLSVAVGRLTEKLLQVLVDKMVQEPWGIDYGLEGHVKRLFILSFQHFYDFAGPNNPPPCV